MSKRKTPSSDNNLNNDFCNVLTELAAYERNTNRNIHKYNAYRKAASILATHPKRIESGDEARKLNGIGDKIGRKFDEFLKSGKLQKIEKIRQDDKISAINLFTRISGIGPDKANELIGSGYTTLNDLKYNIHLLNHHQRLGLKYIHDFELKIPRTEIEEIETIIKKEIATVDAKFLITICGSYRRCRPESKDIEVLLTHTELKCTSNRDFKSKMLKHAIHCLEKCKLVTDRISLEENKFMGACKLKEGPARRLDIRLTPHSQFYCSVLFLTGSDIFNKTIRTHALEQKFSLTEQSLRPIGSTGIPGEPLDISSEEDIFDYIDYPYKKPEDRNM